MIKHIIFDIGQVLVKVNFNEFLFRFLAEFKLNMTELTENLDNGAHIDFMKGKISGEEFHRKTCEHFNHQISLTDFRQLWLRILGGQINETVLIVEDLYQQQHQLSLLSNIDAWHFEYCSSSFPVFEKFDKKFLSFQMGLVKPDPEIFKQVAVGLNAEPVHCLLIDDKIENINAAHNVGFEVVLFADSEQLRRDLQLRGLLPA